MSEQTEEQRKAAQASRNYEQVRSLAQTLGNNDSGCGAVLLKGTVTAYTYPYATVQVEGDTSTSIANIRHWESYTPVVGDTCQLIKQGDSIVAVARINTTTATPGLNGWIQPTLGSGFTHSVDPIMYRIVNDHGDQKIQLRGSCSHTGANTALWTMPSGFRPTSNRVVLLARDNTQSNVAQLLINSAGTMVLGGATSGVAGSSGGPTGFRTGVDPGTAITGNTDVNHTHLSSDGPNPATPSSWTTTINTGFTNHNHAMGQHQHALDRVLDPSALWFTGIEYFLT